jgi:hypothetical protein
MCKPSEKYSWSFFSLMSVKGSTAIDLSEIGGNAASGAAGTAADDAAGRPGRNRLAKR